MASRWAGVVVGCIRDLSLCFRICGKCARVSLSVNEEVKICLMWG